MEITLLQKRFVVSTVKSFFVSVNSVDTILRIQKIDYFLYRLFSVDTQNRFSKIKKIGAQIWARWAQIGPCTPTSVEVDVVVGSPQASVGESRPSRSWSSGASSATGSSESASTASSSGASSPRPSRTPSAAEHHLHLASDWSHRRRLRLELPRTPT
jgi:hypothetical protein